MSRSLQADVLLVFITLIWGANFVVIKNALGDISPLLFNAVRMSVAAVLLAAVFRRELAKLNRKVLGAGFLVGACLCLGNEFQTVGLRYTTPSKSAFLTGISVVLVPVFLALFWRRPVNRWSALGVGSAFAGLFLLSVPGFSASTLLTMGHGDVLTLGAAVAFAFHVIFVGHTTQTHRWQQITLIQVAVTALLMIAALPFADRMHVVWSARVIWGIGITSCLSLAFAFSVQAWAQQFTPPTHAALIFTLEPVFAWLTSFIILGERMGWRATIGAWFILAGVFVSEVKGSIESMAVSPDHAGVPAAGTRS
jgi:drug/metabolite transporter (DMT)-like permease